jgi:hypothetical protein
VAHAGGACYPAGRVRDTLSPIPARGLARQRPGPVRLPGRLPRPGAGTSFHFLTKNPRNRRGPVPRR